MELRVIENVCSGFNDLSIEIYDEKGSVMASLKARKNMVSGFIRYDDKRVDLMEGEIIPSSYGK